MRTANAMQLKARIKNRVKEAGIPAQAMMQNYLLERLLERLSKSEWRDKVIVKGGMLISSLVGVASRTTMDLDSVLSYERDPGFVFRLRRKRAFANAPRK